MTEAEEKAREEKLAAAKKRFEQIKKQKGKKATVTKTDEKPKTGEEAQPAPAGSKDAEQGTREPTDPRAAADNDVNSTEPASLPKKDSPEVEDGVLDEPGSPASHTHQPSVSVQSKLRSSSFRQSSGPQTPLSPSSANLKSLNLPPLSPDGDSMTDIYRKQASRLEHLERENRRLERELNEGEGWRNRMEDELEELREAKGELVALKERLHKAESREDVVDKLQGEIASLQRQNAHLQSQSSKSARRISSPGQSQLTTSTSSDLEETLRSKSATIESMEVDISNLRAELKKQSTSFAARDEQISALEEKLEKSERTAELSRRELTDLKKNLERTSERAVKEGSQRTSAETKIHSLERELEDGKKSVDAVQSKCDGLEQKLTALTTLYKESEARSQARSKERDRLDEEATDLRKRLTFADRELLSLREEKERIGKKNTQGTDDEGMDELEDEERHRLQLQVRELEGEVFELKRGFWRERKREIDDGHGPGEGALSPHSKFDDIDLSGGLNSGRGLGAAKGQSFSDVLSGGLTALTGRGLAAGRSGDMEEEDLGFDEDAFRNAQADEARLRTERIKEVKRNLKQWEGWRLDLVESRIGGGGNGEIFDV